MRRALPAGLVGYLTSLAILGLVPPSRPERALGYLVFLVVFLGLGGIVAYHTERIRSAMRKQILLTGEHLPFSYYTGWYPLSVDVGGDRVLLNHQRQARRLLVFASAGFFSVALLDVLVLAPSLYPR